MQFIKTSIPDVVMIEPKVWSDARGYFFESYREDIFQQHIGHIDWVQDNESYSTYGTLRGLHYQLAPHAQSKLVRVVQGKVLDVAVDLRQSSPTFGQHVAVELSAENKRQLFIPRGFAHGFVVLSQTALFQYKVDNYYNKEADRGIAFNDPVLKIDWQIDLSAVQLSDKDNKQPALKDADLFA
ncbi:MAG: dTDP-4-dehydrorhamnose 3,5-epimerase [Proteobacteria bacterium]|nr:dTDP-4-dehydrorhamnose 3,5-epimerase [Pseudomonadota bacterium]